MNLRNPRLTQDAFDLFDQGRSVREVQAILKIPNPALYGWIRKRAEIERELARRREQDRLAAVQAKRREQTLVRAREQGRVPQTTVDAIRKMREDERVELAPGFTTAPTIIEMARRFGVDRGVMHDILYRKGSYTK